MVRAWREVPSRSKYLWLGEITQAEALGGDLRILDGVARGSCGFGQACQSGVSVGIGSTANVIGHELRLLMGQAYLEEVPAHHREGA